MAVFNRPLSLRAKVIALIILIVAAVLSVSTYLSVRLSEELLEAEAKEDAIKLARELAGGTWSRADLEDVPNLNREIKEVMALRPLVRGIDVFSFTPDGLTLVSSSSGMGGDLVPVSSAPQKVTAKLGGDRNGRFWEVTAPVRVGDELAGALRVKVSLTRADALVAGARLQFALIMGASVVLIVVVLSTFFHQAVDSPIRGLIQAMERAEAGNLSVRAAVRPGDEIGDLGDSLNRMLNRIEEGYHQNVELLQQINRLNEALKEKVRIATQELEERNEELRRANELLFDTQLQLGRSERLAMVGQMAASIAHEIGTPLTSISGHIQLLLQEPGVEPSTESRLKIVEGQIARTVEILQGILKLARPPEPTLKSLDVNGPLQEILDLASPGLGLKKVIVTTRLAGDLPRVLGDAPQLQQVFLNLIINALDAMPDGGELTVETDAVHGYAGRNGSPWVRIQITDTGRGIAPEDQKRIFDPFFTTKDVGRGTGLGLAVCQRIIKAHRGAIELKSEDGRGTAFAVLLPPQET